MIDLTQRVNRLFARIGHSLISEHNNSGASVEKQRINVDKFVAQGESSEIISEQDDILAELQKGIPSIQKELGEAVVELRALVVALTSKLDSHDKDLQRAIESLQHAGL